MVTIGLHLPAYRCGVGTLVLLASVVLSMCVQAQSRVDGPVPAWRGQHALHTPTGRAATARPTQAQQRLARLSDLMHGLWRGQPGPHPSTAASHALLTEGIYAWDDYQGYSGGMRYRIRYDQHQRIERLSYFDTTTGAPLGYDSLQYAPDGLIQHWFSVERDSTGILGQWRIYAERDSVGRVGHVHYEFDDGLAGGLAHTRDSLVYANLTDTLPVAIWLTDRLAGDQLLGGSDSIRWEPGASVAAYFPLTYSRLEQDWRLDRGVAYCRIHGNDNNSFTILQAVRSSVTTTGGQRIRQVTYFPYDTAVSAPLLGQPHDRYRYIHDAYGHLVSELNSQYDLSTQEWIAGGWDTTRYDLNAAGQFTGWRSQHINLRDGSDHGYRRLRLFGPAAARPRLVLRDLPIYVQGHTLYAPALPAGVLELLSVAGRRVVRHAHPGGALALPLAVPAGVYAVRHTGRDGTVSQRRVAVGY